MLFVVIHLYKISQNAPECTIFCIFFQGSVRKGGWLEVCRAPRGKLLPASSVQAVQLLQDAQTRAEQQLLAADPPPLRLDETDKSDS